MSLPRIERLFARRRAAGTTALVPYLMAGDPDLDTSLRLMHAAVDAGADLIELGMPFADPMADGPVIQLACERALAAGTGVLDVLALVRRFRQQDDSTPLILMGYLNPIERFGYARFAAAAAEAGVDGVLVVDVPPEEGGELHAALRGQQLATIYLVAPTTAPARMAQIAQAASGFVYYVSLKGVTGAASLDTAAVAERVGQLRAHSALPVAVGFGVRDAKAAAEVARVADAVVVGSALVATVAEHAADVQAAETALRARLGELRAAIDRCDADKEFA